MVVVFFVIGALIGAGFASGQEIYAFFYKYGVNGLLGLIICSILTGFVIYKTFRILLNSNRNIDNYENFLNIIINKKTKFIKIINLIINISLLITFFVMVSGFGAYFEQEFRINKIIGATILAIICFVVFMTDIKGVTKTNSVVVPILILCILIIGIFNLKNLDINLIGKNLDCQINGAKWIWQSIIYCSYNMLLLIPVLVSIKNYIKSEKQIKYISIFCGLIVFILALNVYMLLVKVDIDFSLIEMPAVYVISKNFSVLRFVYGIIILLSIFTTAISVGISFLDNIVKNKSYFPQFAAIMCITSVIISNFGFSNLVNFSFPIFGYLGLIQMFLISFKVI